ncbi:MAG TPA: hypothetical protein VGI40_07190 [Pirellulaceae bacterium]|jgi:hypothetical protein
MAIHLTNVAAEFDGKVFVPQQAIDLPVGTKAIIAVETPLAPMPSRPQPPTEEERREWEQFIEEINKTEPYFPTVEAALGYSRKYPGYYP